MSWTSVSVNLSYSDDPQQTSTVESSASTPNDTRRRKVEKQCPHVSWGHCFSTFLRRVPFGVNDIL